MKKIIVCLISLILFSINVSAQISLRDSSSRYFLTQSPHKDFKVYEKKSRIPESVKVIAIYAGSIILDAVGDGLNDSGEKGWGNACNILSTGFLLASPFVINYDKSKWAWYLTSYVSLRIALFDYSYNLTRGLPLTYNKNTSTWDKFLGKMKPPDGFAIGRSVFFIVGVSVPINQLGSKKKNHK